MGLISQHPQSPTFHRNSNFILRFSHPASEHLNKTLSDSSGEGKISMASTSTNSTKPSGPTKPELPPNVLIFSPKNQTAADALLSGRIFTRLTATAATEPEQLSAALEKMASPEIRESFCLAYRNGILIYDGVNKDLGDADLTDLHHEHFRQVCLALKDADIDLDFAGCVFDSPAILQAGFQLDTLRPGTLLVIDLMKGGDDDDDDAAEASLGDLLALGR